MFQLSEKNLLNSNIFSTCPHNMVNIDQFGTPQQISTRFEYWLRYCSNVAQLSPIKLCMMFGVSWAGTLCIHFWGFLIRSGILPGAKFTLSPKLALSYFGSVTAQHSRSGRQPNFAALSRGCHLYLAGQPSRWALAHILVAFVQQAFSSP